MLDPRSQEFLALLRQQEGPPFETLPVDALRAAMDAMAATDSAGPDIARVQDIAATLSHASLSVRLYHPSPGTTLPVLIYFHGGGWISWNVQSHDPICRRLSAAGRFAVVSVEYRLAPEHPYPAAVDDAIGVCNWIVAQADELEVDPRNMGIAGDSAGGNLAAVVTQLARDRGGPPLRFQALVYPVTDATMSLPAYVEHADDGSLTAAVMRRFIDSYVPNREQRSLPTVSPLFADSCANLPPALVIVAEYDPLRDDGLQYAKRLQGAGVPVRLEHFSESMHGFLSMGGVIGPESGVRAVESIASAFNRACR